MIKKRVPKKTGSTVRTPLNRQFLREFGAVAILDALGASSYSEQDIVQFLRSRDRALADLNAWVEEPHGSVRIEASQLVTFTFNDTIVIVVRCGGSPADLSTATSFTALLRKFLVDSMAGNLLFRGAASIGTFYVDQRTNTVMGDAVTDAAQWYESANWVGVHFTPRSFLYLSKMFETTDDNKRWAFIPYEVPIRNGTSLKTYAVNWPKIFLLPKLRPWSGDPLPRSQLLKLLSRHKVPAGTEQKYFNTVGFFDHSLRLESEKIPTDTRIRTRG
jgi:hypothetical protein